MDILKWVNKALLLIILIMIIGCETKYSDTDGPRTISIEKWEQPFPKKISIKQYKKNTNFSNIENIDSLFIIDTIHVDKGDMSLSFDTFNAFLPNKDFILTIDDKEYRLSNIHWKNDTIKGGMGDSWHITRYADTININGKNYNCYLGFGIPKAARK
jgi:hypothetical protein